MPPMPMSPPLFDAAAVFRFRLLSLPLFSR